MANAKELQLTELLVMFLRRGYDMRKMEAIECPVNEELWAWFAVPVTCARSRTDKMRLVVLGTTARCTADAVTRLAEICSKGSATTRSADKGPSATPSSSNRRRKTRAAPACASENPVFARCEAFTFVFWTSQIAHARKVLQVLHARGWDVEWFEADFFNVSVPDHVYVPKHERVVFKDEQERAAHLKKLCVRHASQLPHLQLEDAVARYYGFRPGDVVFVRREPGLQKPHVQYRTVSTKNVLRYCFCHDDDQPHP